MADLEATIQVRVKVPEKYQHPQGGVIIDSYVDFIQEMLKPVSGHMTRYHAEKTVRLPSLDNKATVEAPK